MTELRGAILGGPDPTEVPASVPEGARPQLAWLRVADCHVDERYQRDITSRRSQALIEKIAEHFDWRRFGAVVVMRWAEKRGWAVIDGQHRTAGAARRAITHVPGLVYPEMSIGEAAGLFAALNRDRVAVTPLHVFHAMLAARDSEALAVAAACERAGASVARYPKPVHEMVRGETMAVASLEAVLRRHGPSVLERTLTLLVRAWDEPGHLRATLIRGLADLLAKHGDDIEDGRMVKALAADSGAGWCSIAASAREEGTSTAAAAMAAALGRAAGIRGASAEFTSLGPRETGALLTTSAQRRCQSCSKFFLTRDLNEVLCAMCREVRL
ncbi:MAG: DUF6551 family protein [Alphaproteobacteria bacterium]